MKFKKQLCAIAGVATLATMTALSGPAFAAGGINGTGTVHCSSLTGSIKFSPPYKNGGTATSTTVSIKAKASGCSGTGDGATVVSVSSTGSSHGTTNDCAALASPSSNPNTTNAKYKVTHGSPKLNNSTIVFTSTTGGIDGSGNAFFDTSGSVTAGSFNGNATTAHANVGSAAAIGAKCASNGGLKSLKILSGSTGP